MVNRPLLAAKLAELQARVARVQKHRKASAAELGADTDALDLVSFNLMLAVQTCADIASHIIADAGWPVARSLAEGFVRLEERGVLSATTSAALARAAGLRNIVAHGYASLDIELVQRASSAGLADIDTFAREVAAWAQNPSS